MGGHARFQGREHREDSSNVLRARPSSFFLRSPAQERLYAALRRALQKTNPLWPAELVRCAAEKIALPEPVGGQFANPLRRVTEKRHGPLLAERQRLAPRLQHAARIVRRHE